MTRKELIQEAKVLFAGTNKQENPEYLRALVELITYCTLLDDEDNDVVMEEIEVGILK